MRDSAGLQVSWSVFALHARMHEVLGSVHSTEEQRRFQVSAMRGGNLAGSIRKAGKIRATDVASTD